MRHHTEDDEISLLVITFAGVVPGMRETRVICFDGPVTEKAENPASP